MKSAAEARKLACWKKAEAIRAKRLLPIFVLTILTTTVSSTVALSHSVAWLGHPKDLDSVPWLPIAVMALAAFAVMLTGFWIIYFVDRRTATQCPQCRAAMAGDSLHRVRQTRRCPHCDGSIVADRRPTRPEAARRNRARQQRMYARRSVDFLLLVLAPLEVFAVWHEVIVPLLPLAIAGVYGAIRLGRASRIILATCLLLFPCMFLTGIAAVQ